MGHLADDLAHLDATLRLFSSAIDLRTTRAKAHRLRSRFFRPGEWQRMVLDIFREAQGAALRSRQIGEALTARRGLEPTPVMIEQMRKSGIGVVVEVRRRRLADLADVETTKAGEIRFCQVVGRAVIGAVRLAVVHPAERVLGR